MTSEQAAGPRAYAIEIAWGVALGLIGSAFALVFVLVTNKGIKLLFPGTPDPHPFTGSWHIVVITTVAGLIVGLIHHFRPAKEEDVFDAVPEGRLDPVPMPGGVLVAAISLIGGFSLGPEVPTGMFGAGFATWISDHFKLSEDARRTNVLAAVMGTYGGLFTAPIGVLVMGYELAHQQSRAYFKTLLVGALSAVAGFALFYGAHHNQFSPLLRILNLPPYTLELWHLLVGIVLGFVGCALAVVFGLSLQMWKRAISMARLDRLPILRCTLAGVVFGLLGMALPLTLFLGVDGLDPVTNHAAEIGLGLLLVLVLLKLVATTGALANGFIGGPIFPLLFAGAAAGSAIHLAFPQIPLAICVTCMMAALPAALTPVPGGIGLVVFLIAGISETQAIPMFLSAFVAFVCFQPFAARAARKAAEKAQQARPATAATQPEPSVG